MQSIQLFIGLFLIVVFSEPSFAKNIYYPTNQVERPLTLPVGVWEIGAGVGNVEWDDESSNTLYPVFSLRYGITPSLELYLAGVKYKILSHNKPLELIIKARIAGFGHSSNSGTLVLAELGAEGKQRVIPGFAILYRIENYYGYNSKDEDTNDLRFSIGQVISFTDKLSLEMLGTYRLLTGFDASTAYIVGGAVRYNFSSTLDIVFEGSAGDFDENDELRSQTKSFKQEYGAKINWRF